MGRMSDERFNELLSQTADPAAIARGLEIHQSLTGQSYPGAQPRRNVDSRHAHYIAIRTDEVLYRAGILTAEQCHRDCDLSATPDAKLLVRDMLSLGGIRVSDENTLEFYRAGMTTSDFPLLLENLGNKSLTLGYGSAPETWQLWTRTTTTKNFREFTRPQAATWPTPGEVAENEQVPYASLTDGAAERGAIKSYSEVLSISREILINDDLQSFARAAFEAGRAISRLIGDLAYAVLTGNPLLSDGTALFAAGHGNDDSTPAAPSVAALDAMRTLMAAQTGPQGEALNLRPRFIIGPPNLEGTLAVLRAAQNSADPSDQSTGLITTLTDSRLSGTAWYGACDPRLHDAVQIVMLEGGELPRFERKRSQHLSSDSIDFFIGHDCIALATDYRTVARNTGA